MKKLIAAVAVLSVLGAFQPAQAAKKAKPVKTTFYLHGAEAIGEVDLVNNFGAGFNAMDSTKPTETAPKSITGLLWAGYPWNDCAAMYGLPVWVGNMAGQVKGDMKLTLHTASTGARQVEVEIWADAAAMSCKSNDLSEGAYPEPAAMAIVDLPPGVAKTEVVFEGVDVKVLGSLTLQISSVNPASGRILYDATDYASALEFNCIPSKGAKTCA